MATHKVIPSQAPQELEKSTTIHKIVEYVVRNGEAFQAKLKQTEINNPQFDFLYYNLNEGANLYYRWRLFCALSDYTEDQIHIIEEFHRHKLDQNIGTLDLIEEDQDLLMSLLFQNNGSKDSIKGIRKWILNRSHSILPISQNIYKYLKTLMDTPNENTYIKCLHCIYVINDLLFNGSSATTKGPYTSISKTEKPVPIFQKLFPLIPWMLQSTYRLATTDVEKERVLKMVQLWVSKGFIEQSLGTHITNLILQVNMIPEPQLSTSFTTPYLDIDPQILQSMSSQFTQQIALPYMTPNSLNTQPFYMNPTMTIMPYPIPPPPTPLTGGTLLPYLSQLPSQPTSFFSSSPLSTVGNNFPIPMMPTMPVLDLTKTSVGVMANLIKSAVKSGHPSYTPVDMNIISQAVPTHIEPGRLEARINDFYKKVEDILNPIHPSSSSYKYEYKRTKRDTSSTTISTTSHDNHHNSHHTRDMDTTTSSSSSRPHHRDEYESRSGLGASKVERRDSIDNSYHIPPNGNNNNDVSQFRSQLSNDYHKRISAREAQKQYQ